MTSIKTEVWFSLSMSEVHLLVKVLVADPQGLSKANTPSFFKTPRYRFIQNVVGYALVCDLPYSSLSWSPNVTHDLVALKTYSSVIDWAIILCRRFDRVKLECQSLGIVSKHRLIQMLCSVYLISHYQKEIHL